MRVLGMISGTSVDGIDVAVADLDTDDGVLRLRPVGHRTVRYPDGLAERVLAALPPARVPMAEVCALDTLVGQAFAAAAERAIAELAEGTVDLVVSHGQTVFHWVEGGTVRGTLQLGQPAWIAAATGTPVVADLRSADVAAGGQGAPLVSLIDLWWLSSRPGTALALNLGGIANLTAPATPELPAVAYDTGPANALVDALVRDRAGEPYDRDGRRAAAGRVDSEALERLLAEPYYARPAPKSTGKELLHLGHLDDRLGPSWRHQTPLDDAVATLTALSATTVADAVADHRATELVVSGGGTANGTLMRWIADRLPGVEVVSSDALGLSSDGKEAYAFAVLGWLTWHGLPGTVPSCTGAGRPSVLGVLLPGRLPLRLPAPPDPAPTSLLVSG